jgi:hypothetical protein
MNARLRRAFIVAACASLAACAVSGGRGIDPRDSAGQNGAVADSGGVPGVLSVFTGSMLFNWVQKNFFKPERDDAPPPPLPDGVASGTANGGDPNNAGRDCGDPAQRTDANPRCK